MNFNIIFVLANEKNGILVCTTNEFTEMKKIVYLFIVFALNISAQDFTFNPSSSYIAEGSAENAIDVKVYVQNETGFSLRDWEWVLLDIDQPAVWGDLAICDNNTCYTGLEAGDTSVLAAVPADATFSFKITFAPNSTAGVGTVKLAFYNPDDTTGKMDTVTIGFDTWPLSVKEATGIDFSIYPNPTSDELNINLGAPQSGNLMIYNFIGQVVYSEMLVNVTSTTLNMENLPNGNYFVKWEGAANSITKKVVKR